MEKLEEWQIKIIKELPKKVIINNRRWAGKKNYYKQIAELIERGLI